MRTILPALALLLSAGAALAQTEPLRPAPVPGISDGRVAPADRAGTSNAASNSSPFAGAPANPIGQPTPQTLPGTQREAAPAPNLSR